MLPISPKQLDNVLINSVDFVFSKELYLYILFYESGAKKTGSILDSLSQNQQHSVAFTLL